MARVTVQLPIFNELHTIDRLLTAVSRLDYPRDRLGIQVLDDSTDRTNQIASHQVDSLRGLGTNIVHIARADRTGFKGGALAHGLEIARGEFVAIFDADFVPRPDFLRQVIPHFADPNVGCVQTRWGFTNREYSLLTRTQALGVDGHFVVEQSARSNAQLFMNFNGTAGVWRRACIEDAGGWQGDTLTEDLDLSYRAQLRGWRIAYLPDVVVPSELPAQISAFERQQARWAQGSIETAVKLGGRLLRSRGPWWRKVAGAFHLTGYAVHPLMILVVLLALPMSFSQSWVLKAAPWLMVAAAGPPAMYAVAQIYGNTDNHAAGPKGVHRDSRWGRLRLLPFLILAGIGLSFRNTLAVIRALLRVRSGFHRTPKFDVRSREDCWYGSIYALKIDSLVWAELGFAVYSLATVILPGANYTFMPWMLLYAASFVFVAAVNLFQSYQRSRWLATKPRSAARTLARTPPSVWSRIRGGWLDRGT